MSKSIDYESLIKLVSPNYEFKSLNLKIFPSLLDLISLRALVCWTKSLI